MMDSAVKKALRCVLSCQSCEDVHKYPTCSANSLSGYGFITCSLPEYSLYHGAEVVSASRIAPLHQRL